MRLLKVPVLLLLAMVVFGDAAHAQLTCDQITRSTRDSVYVVNTVGKPGDTVEVPFYMKTDSIVAGFQFLVKFDTTKLQPIFTRDSICTEVDPFDQCISWLVDTTFIANTIRNRFVVLDSTLNFPVWEYDTVTNFNATLFQNRQDVIACNFLPFDKIDSIPGGRGVIFTLDFLLKPDVPHQSRAFFHFISEDVCFPLPGSDPPRDTCVSCNTTQLTTLWLDGFNFLVDTTIVGTDTTVDSTVVASQVQVYPTLLDSVQMQVFADTGFTPQDAPSIDNFTVLPTAVQPGQQLTLAWTASNVAELEITGPSSSLPTTTTSLTGELSVTAPSSPGQYTYTITGTQSVTNLTATASRTITVQEEVDGDAPTISFTPSDLSYTINQGETVSFGVSASEPNGDQVTLQATNLPNNSTFTPSNPVVGNSSVSANFSFTPDFGQQGTFVINFTATDVDGTDSRSISISVEELEVDRLFSTSAPGQAPVGGLKGTNGIFFPINLVTSKTVYGVQFDIAWPASIVSIDSFVVTGRTPEYVVYDDIGSQPGQARVVTFGLNNEPVESDTSSAVLWAVMTLDSSAVPWVSYPIYIENGRESINPDPNVGSLPLVTDSGIVDIDSIGDVNVDKIIDVDDAVGAVSSIIQTFQLNRRQFATADVIRNDTVNVFDLVGVVNLIYDITPTPSPGPVSPGDTAMLLLAHADLEAGGSDVMTVVSEGIPEEVAGVQLELQYDPNAVELGRPTRTDYNSRFAVSYRDDGNGRMRVVLWHADPRQTDEMIQTGYADLLNIPITAKSTVKAGDKSKLRITEGFMATTTAASIPVAGVEPPTPPSVPASFVLEQNYPNPFNPSTKIRFALSQPAEVELKIFNVLGQEVTTLIDGKMEAADNHEIIWDATDQDGQRVATGIYLYRLTVGENAQTRKMLFLK